MSDTNSQATITDLINELEWRGLLKDCTDEEGLRKHLEGGARKIYAGFDPTADSLTIGNLVPIMLLAHVKRAGHTPVVVMGGGTGLIGDPSGKSAERQLNTPGTINKFIDKQRPIYSAVLGMEGEDFLLKNNHEWLEKISFIEALRDIGKHFSVNMMMQKESVKDRLNNREQGISYTEFSYMILQAYDFLHLYWGDHPYHDDPDSVGESKPPQSEMDRVTVQIGGSDQYGNIVAGADLIRRIKHWYDFKRAQRKAGQGLGDVVTHSSDSDQAVFGLTAPLVAKADGGKFGKTETGAVWLTAARTSPYAYYQFWLNSSDEDAANWIKVFTFLPEHTTSVKGVEVEGIVELSARHGKNPGKRELQRRLAQEATKILHGESAMNNAEAAGKALFSGEIGSLDAQTMSEVFASVPTTEHSKADLADGVEMVGLLKALNLASSNREARDFLNEGSVSINGSKITIETKLGETDLLHGEFIAIRRGKKKWHMTKWG